MTEGTHRRQRGGRGGLDRPSGQATVDVGAWRADGLSDSIA